MRETSAPRPQGPPNTHRISVLLVEDSPGDAVLTQRALERVAGLSFDVHTAETVADAVAALAHIRPDVVLLDLNLPDAVGLSGVDAVVAAAFQTAVVVLTGQNDDALGQQAVQRGAQDYMRKDDLATGKLGQAIEYAVYRVALTSDVYQSEEWFHGLFNEAPVPMRSIGLDGRIVDVNSAFVRLSGHPAGDLVGRLSTNIVHPDDAVGSTAALTKLLDGGAERVTYEERLVRRDGELRHLRVSAGIVRTRSGEPSHVSNVCEDITEQRVAQAQVAFQARLLDSVGQAVVATDPRGTLTYFNKAAQSMFGLTPGHLGAPAADVLPVFPNGSVPTSAGVRELPLTDADGRCFTGLVALTPPLRDRHRSDGAIAVVANIDEVKQAQLLLARSEARLRSLVENITDVITVHSAGGVCRYMSPSGQRLLGLDPDAGPAAIADLMARVHPDDHPSVLRAFEHWRSGRSDQVDYRMRTSDDTWIHCESLGINLLDDPAVGGIVVTTRDITDRKRAEAALEHQALHDALTGLPNRTLFVDRLNHALARAPRAGTRVAVLFLDLDNFKLINDSFGHHAGDEVLAAASKLLEAAMRPGDTIARLGGDEFGVVCEGINDVADAEAFAERLGAMLRLPFGISGHQVHVTTSIGIALSDGLRQRADELLQDADVALYRAKDSGRACAAVYDDDLKARARRRLEIEESLRVALDNHELSLHYQPQVNLNTGRLTGFEALLRWTHPELGEVSPDEFIPIMEQTDLVFSIGRWVLERAVRRVADWRRRLTDWDLAVSVNLSSRQLADAGLTDLISAMLEEAELDPSALCLELTESIVMDDAEASVRMLRSLKSLGVRIAIDDFGTGYSSLAYLKRFPVDFLKVDRTFVAGLGRDPEDTVIVASVVDLGRSLGLDVVAEGVETATQLDELEALGCSFGQGFYWSKALPPAAVEDLIALAEQNDGVLSPPRAGAERRHRQSDAERDDVVATLAHELRTPITVIRGFAETMGDFIRAGRTDVLESALDAITRQTQGMEQVLSSLADARAVDSGTLVLQAAVADMASVATEIVDDAVHGLADHQVATRVDGTAPVLVDRNRMRQILTNLLSNAVKHSPAGATIDVVVEADEAEARVRVIDCGPGISPDRLGELFRKFSRLDRRVKGTGLGLFLARTLARAHGGDVLYRRATTGGAEFTVTLPVATTAGPAAGPAGGPARRLDAHPAAITAAVSPAPRRDADAVAALYEATREVLCASAPEEVVGAVIHLVADVGGRITGDRGHAAALAFDLSLGHGDPLYAAAEPVSVTRSRLEYALPRLLGDAGRVLSSPPATSAPADGVDRLTGLAKRKAVTIPEDAGQLGVVLVDLDGLADLVEQHGRAEGVRVTRSFARAVRFAVRPWGQAARANNGFILWGDEATLRAQDLLTSLRGAWESVQPHPLTFSVGVAVSSEAGPRVVRAARRALRLDQTLQISRNR